MNVKKLNRNDFDAKLVARRFGIQFFVNRFFSDLKATYAEELGREIPAEAKIIVLEERGDTFYVVLPCLPEALKTEKGVIDAVAGRQ